MAVYSEPMFDGYISTLAMNLYRSPPPYMMKPWRTNPGIVVPIPVLATSSGIIGCACNTCRDARENAAKRETDDTPSPVGDLPSKYHKYKRRKSSEESSESQQTTEEENSKKCAGTQTQFTSFATEAAYLHNSLESGYAPPSYRTATNGRGYPDSCSPPSPKRAAPSPPFMHHQMPVMPTHPYLNRYNGRHEPTPAAAPSNAQAITNSHIQRGGSYNHSLPLNLTMSSESHQQHRPSVITRLSSSSSSSPPPYSSSSQPPASSASPGFLNRGSQAGSRGSHEVRSVVVSDSDIDEHFRRSLGKHYTESMSSASSPALPSPTTTPPVAMVTPMTPPLQNNSPPPPQPQKDVSVTGTVDDHFAKSLGATWNQIQAREQAAKDMDAVDDHFAKALGGDTWLKLKTQKSSGASNSSAPSSPESSSQLGRTQSPH